MRSWQKTVKRVAVAVLAVGVTGAVLLAGDTVYEYDSNNRLKTASYTNGVTAKYHYDLAHNLIGVGKVADTDEDGLPDYWELKYFGDLTTTDGTGDQDGDGLSDYEEYLAATDPTSGSSRFYVFHGSSNPSTNVLHWTSASNRTYTIEHTTNLVETAFSTLESGIEGTPPVNEYRHTVTTHANFYQIKLDTEGGAE